jgi:hydroxymethylbilane synthase
MPGRIVIGSRGSDLALTQSRHVAALLRELHPGLEVHIEVISTKGDRITDVPLAKVGGKGLFTKELEVALLDGSIDLAVHSLKDLPTELPEGLALAAVPPREDPHDALISAKGLGLAALPRGARVGTSSLRRRVQLLACRPDLDIVDLRGNVPTRLQKLHDLGLDAIVLAAAGLRRLGLQDAITELLPPSVMISAVGQGALGIETRSDDPRTRALLAPLHDTATAAATTAERSLLAAMGGGCQVPIGALAQVNGDRLELTACVCSTDGLTVLRVQLDGATTDAAALGRRAAEQLSEAGAGPLIANAVAIAEGTAHSLAGLRVVVTRAQDGAGRLSDLLSERGATVHAFATIAIEPREQVALPGPAEDYAWVVFTSANAVSCFGDALARDGRNLHEFRSCSICAIGPATAEALQQRGMPVSLVPSEAVAERIAETFAALGDLTGQRILLPRGNLARTILPDTLSALGAIPEECVVYNTSPVKHTPEELDALLAFAPAVVAFTSGSAVENLFNALGAERGEALFGAAASAAIGPITAEALRQRGVVPEVEATRHDLPGLVDAIVAHWGKPAR